MDNLNKAIAFNRMPITSNETENKEEKKNPPTHKIGPKSVKNT